MSEEKRVRIKYFWIAIVGAGSAGIWLPILIALFKNICEYSFRDIPPNLTTYFLAILISGCLDQGLKLFGDEANRSKNEFLNIIAVVCITFILVLVSVLGTLNSQHWIAFLVSCFGVWFAIKIWWNVNINSQDGNSLSILGGTP